MHGRNFLERWQLWLTLWLALIGAAISVELNGAPPMRESDISLSEKIVFGVDTAVSCKELSFGIIIDCGEYTSTLLYQNNSNYLDSSLPLAISIHYTFSGKNAQIPHSFRLKLSPEKRITELDPFHVEDPVLLVDYEEE